VYKRQAYDRSDLRTAIIASADLSHVLKPAGPYGYHSAGPLFDKLVVKAIKEKDAGQLLRLGAGFLERAAECGLRSILFLMGAFEGRAYEAEVLSYEGPFGVGYLVATFMPSESEEQIKDA
jgi:aromatic ring-opening dioxygenase LigB subunit